MERTTPTRRQFAAALGAAGVIGLAGCGGGGDSDGEYEQTDTVEMTNVNDFVPQRVEVSVDTTVTWENAGSIDHTVTAYEDEIPEAAEYFASGGFDSEDAATGDPTGGDIGGDGTYEHTFETPGEYHYFCIPHEMSGMEGWVRVVESAAD